MKIRDKRHFNRLIRELAQKEGVSPRYFRMAMQEAIDIAWNNRENNGASAAWLKYFPTGEKPSLEDFVARLAQELSQDS